MAGLHEHDILQQSFILEKILLTVNTFWSCLYRFDFIEYRCSLFLLLIVFSCVCQCIFSSPPPLMDMVLELRCDIMEIACSFVLVIHLHSTTDTHIVIEQTYCFKDTPSLPCSMLPPAPSSLVPTLHALFTLLHSLLHPPWVAPSLQFSSRPPPYPAPSMCIPLSSLSSTDVVSSSIFQTVYSALFSFHLKF